MAAVSVAPRRSVHGSAHTTTSWSRSLASNGNYSWPGPMIAVAGPGWLRRPRCSPRAFDRTGGITPGTYQVKSDTLGTLSPLRRGSQDLARRPAWKNPQIRMSMSDVGSERSLLLGPRSAVAGYRGGLGTRSLSRASGYMIVAASRPVGRHTWLGPHALDGMWGCARVRCKICGADSLPIWHATFPGSPASVFPLGI